MLMGLEWDEIWYRDLTKTLKRLVLYLHLAAISIRADSRHFIMCCFCSSSTKLSFTIFSNMWKKGRNCWHPQRKQLQMKTRYAAYNIGSRTRGRNLMGRDGSCTLFLSANDHGTWRSMKQWLGCDPWHPRGFSSCAAKEGSHSLTWLHFSTM